MRFTAVSAVALVGLSTAEGSMLTKRRHHHKAGWTALQKAHEGRKATPKFAEKMSEIKEKRKQRQAHITNEEAFQEMKEKIPEDDRASMQQLVEQGRSGVNAAANATDENTLWVKSVASLNDMFLASEDERIQLETACAADLFNMDHRIWLIYSTVEQIQLSRQEADGNMKNAKSNYDATNEKAKKALEELEQLRAKHAMEMGPEEKLLEELEGNAELFRFIMNQVEKKCEGEAEPTLLMQTDTGMETKEEKCNRCAHQSPNHAMLELFSDPEVYAAAERDLSLHGMHSMKETLANIHKAEREEMAPKYQQKSETSLIQMKSQSKWDLYGECEVCGQKTLSCNALRVIVGLELECAKQKVRVQEAVIKKMEDRHRSEIEDKNNEITVYEKTMEGFATGESNYLTEMKGYTVPYEENEELMYKVMDQWDVRYEECLAKLTDIEINTYCALKHLRDYMKEGALKALKLNATDIQDCETTEYLYPVGYCAYPHDPDTPVDCIAGDELPSDPELLPEEEWKRDVMADPNQSKKAVDAIGDTDAMGAQMALACPRTLSMQMPCNVFLCARDCEVSEWGYFSECTATCDTGAQQRSRTVVKVQRNGGAKCPPIMETADCFTNACDVPCVLHEDWVDTQGCLSACATVDEPREEFVRKHIAVDAQGEGECPAKNAWKERADLVKCAGEQRLCEGDEICNDLMDLVIIYECSIATKAAGCVTIAGFVTEFMSRLTTVMWGLPTVKLALIKFGNGMAKAKGDGTFIVEPAQLMSDLTSDNSGMQTKVLEDAALMRDFGGNSSYHMGFNNLAQALKLAEKVLDDSSRVSGDMIASKKIMIITKGKRVGECTESVSVAESIRRKGVVVDMMLMTNEGGGEEFEALEEVVTFPPSKHLFFIPGTDKLTELSARTGAVTKLLPKVCVDAISPSEVKKIACEQKWALVHQGRTCHDWTFQISHGPVSLQACRNAAAAQGYKGFVYNDPVDADTGNCFTHREFGLCPQVDDMGTPVEDTCGYVPPHGKDKRGDYVGWENQAFPAQADTSHYRVIQTSSECADVLPAKYAFSEYNSADSFLWGATDKNKKAFLQESHTDESGATFVPGPHDTLSVDGCPRWAREPKKRWSKKKDGKKAGVRCCRKINPRRWTTKSIWNTPYKYITLRVFWTTFRIRVPDWSKSTWGKEWATYEQAIDECKKKGEYRLCTDKEIKARKGCYTGGNLDSLRVWVDVPAPVCPFVLKPSSTR